ncbi:MAG: hypothetical protein ABIP97_10855 [Chthoniobacterales bacterium]
MEKIKIIGALLGLIFVTPLCAEESPQQIDLSKFPAASVDNVVVPVPGEIFVVLDKLGAPKWRDEMRTEEIKPVSDRAQIALLLGTVIADGFVAVEAEDKEAVKNIGKEVLRLAEAINVRKSVITRCKSITDQADARKWSAVRQEFDGALHDVRAAMQELNDDDLAQLVSLGGWVRGTEVLTSVVQKNYSVDGADLLHQPGLINYFDKRIDTMNQRLRKNSLVERIQRMLGKIRPLIGDRDGATISQESVKRIHRMSAEMVNAIKEGN